MKTNEAPEKLYVNIYDHLTQKGYYAFTNKVTEDDTEYVRKNTIIEEACNWLEQTLSPYIPYCDIDIDLAIENFRKYMKGK